MHLKELDANLIVVLDALLIDASVTKAAERLGRSPSAVSHSLANLRTLFGDPLFVRAGQRLVPTARAKALAPTIHVIVSGMESLIRPKAPFDPTSQERNFTIACKGTLELTLLHKFRNSFQHNVPNIALDWHALDMRNGHEGLRNSSIHFLVTDESPHQSVGDFQFQKLNIEAYQTIVRRGHPLSQQKVTLKKFKQYQHIFISNSEGAKSHLEKHLLVQNIRLDNVIECSSSLVGLFLALESEAFVTLPEALIEVLRKHVAFETIKQPFPKLIVPNYLIWHKMYERDECHEWVRDQLISIALDKTS